MARKKTWSCFVSGTDPERSRCMTSGEQVVFKEPEQECAQGTALRLIRVSKGKKSEKGDHRVCGCVDHSNSMGWFSLSLNFT